MSEAGLPGRAGRICLRVRLAAADAIDATGRVDGARLLALFSDVAAALLVRNDGDLGAFRAYEGVEFTEHVFAGDLVEAEGEIIGWGRTSRLMRFEARRLTRPRPDVAPTAADLLDEPIVVCRATGTCNVPRERRRRPPPPPVIVTAVLGALEAPSEIGREAARCRDAGAAIVELVVRPDVTEPPGARERFRELVRAVRRSAPGLLVQGSTVGTAASLETRCHALGGEEGDRPELASFQVASSSRGDDLYENGISTVREIAGRLRDGRTRGEIEILDASHLEIAQGLLQRGIIGPPFQYRLVLGVQGGLGASRRNLEFLLGSLPPAARWSVMDPGRNDLELARLGAELGGNAAVGLAEGLEPDSALYRDGVAPLVARATEHARAIGRGVATADDVKALLR